MKKNNEKRTVITMGEEITRVNISDDKRTVEIFSVLDCSANHIVRPKSTDQFLSKYLETYFPVVKASTLSLECEFLKYKPETEKQSKFKEKLISAINSGATDFRAQRMDPSFDENGKISYIPTKLPITGRTAEWWKENAEKFLPEKGSRLGTTKERILFLGVLIKYLIERERYSINAAWKAVCDQSKYLGHYQDSMNAKWELEPAGNRMIGEWYDLANTNKITINTEYSKFSVCGGCFDDFSERRTLSNIETLALEFEHTSTGWLVLDV